MNCEVEDSTKRGRCLWRNNLPLFWVCRQVHSGLHYRWRELKNGKRWPALQKLRGHLWRFGLRCGTGRLWCQDGSSLVPQSKKRRKKMPLFLRTKVSFLILHFWLQNIVSEKEMRTRNPQIFSLNLCYLIWTLAKFDYSCIQNLITSISVEHTLISCKFQRFIRHL